MGTRGLIGFYYKGITKATYNHLDSYPSGKGIEVLNSIRNRNLEDLRKVFDNIIMVQSNSKPSIAEQKKYSIYANQSVDDGKLDNWYVLLRNIQGTLVPYLNNKVKHMIDNKDFITDSLFCEWAYLINLDKGTFEVWKGFQLKQNKNRYSIPKSKAYKASNKDYYYSCDMIAEYALDKLPTDKEFIKLEEEKE